MRGAGAFRTVRWGIDFLPAGLTLARHRHDSGYATVVLDGTLREASFSGHHLAAPGEVLLHASFDCHSNSRVSRCGTRIIRLPWTRESMEGRWRVRDPDLLARLAGHDPLQAAVALATMVEPLRSCGDDWPAVLAAAINADPSLALGDWALANGLAPATVARGFQRVFGTSARAFRLEARTRQAWRTIVTTQRPLTDIAFEHGFADHAHMSRSIRGMTGRPPRAWRGPARTSAQAAGHCP